MRLAPNFTLAELTKTSQPAFIGQNEPHDELLGAGTDTANMLQEIRDYYDSPLIVHSAYRCRALNKAIGGSPSSQHVKFEAADFHVRGHDLREVFEWIWKKSGIKFGQLILEGHEKGQPAWIHISLGHPYRPKLICGQVLIFDGKTYTLVGHV